MGLNIDILRLCDRQLIVDSDADFVLLDPDTIQPHCTRSGSHAVELALDYLTKSYDHPRALLVCMLPMF